MNNATSRDCDSRLRARVSAFHRWREPADAKARDCRAGSIHLVARSILTPRIWKILIAAAYPFFLLTAKYCEALESTGTIGAFIADTLLPATLIAYAALIFILRKRAI